MEPAIARLPVIFGPKYRKSREANELLKAGCKGDKAKECEKK